MRYNRITNQRSLLFNIKVGVTQEIETIVAKKVDNIWSTWVFNKIVRNSWGVCFVLLHNDSAATAVPQQQCLNRSVSNSAIKVVPRQHCHRNSVTTTVSHQQCHKSSATTSVPQKKCHNSSVTKKAVSQKQCHSSSVTTAVPRQQNHNSSAASGLCKKKFLKK